jgi:hypothetical protein
VVLVAPAVLMTMMGTAHSSEIADLYSSIDSADVTLEGDVADMALRLCLIYEVKLIMARNITPDGDGTWIISWLPFNAEKGSYDICASLWKNGTAVSTKCNDDETVEITWNKTLEPGTYQLRTILLGQGGVIKDLEENMIEDKLLVRSNTTDAVKKASFPEGSAALTMLTTVLLRRRR